MAAVNNQDPPPPTETSDPGLTRAHLEHVLTPLFAELTHQRDEAAQIKAAVANLQQQQGVLHQEVGSMSSGLQSKPRPDPTTFRPDLSRQASLTGPACLSLAGDAAAQAEEISLWEPRLRLSLRQNNLSPDSEEAITAALRSIAPNTRVESFAFDWARTTPPGSQSIGSLVAAIKDRFQTAGHRALAAAKLAKLRYDPNVPIGLFLTELETQYAQAHPHLSDLPGERAAGLGELAVQVIQATDPQLGLAITNLAMDALLAEDRLAQRPPVYTNPLHRIPWRTLQELAQRAQCVQDTVRGGPPSRAQLRTSLGPDPSAMDLGAMSAHQTRSLVPSSQSPDVDMAPAMLHAMSSSQGHRLGARGSRGPLADVIRGSMRHVFGPDRAPVWCLGVPGELLFTAELQTLRRCRGCYKCGSPAGHLDAKGDPQECPCPAELRTKYASPRPQGNM